MKIKPARKSKCLSVYREVNMYRFVKVGKRLAQIKRKPAQLAESEASDG